MKVYQLKAQDGPHQGEEMVIATFTNEQDAFDSLADWSETSKRIWKIWNDLSDEKQDELSGSFWALVPEIYQTSSLRAWIDEYDVVENYDGKTYDFDLSILKF
jgi:hypothetical protein